MGCKVKGSESQEILEVSPQTIETPRPWILKPGISKKITVVILLIPILYKDTVYCVLIPMIHAIYVHAM